MLLAGCSRGGKENAAGKSETGKVDLSGYKNADIFITPQELSAKLGQKDLIIFDFNKPDVYAKGHLPGAINVSWTNFSYMEGKPGDKKWGAIYNKDDLAKALQSYGVDNRKTVVAYSDVLKGPGPDGRLIWQLRMAGFTNAKLLYGGMAYWEKTGGQLTTEPAKAQPSPVPPVLKDFDESYNATTEYVAENLGKTKIVDCRTKKEFDGAQNNGEARGGHIQGAIFLEWKDLLNADATPKPAAEIVAIMKDKGITPGDDFVVY
ncbi:MAG: sulfurtransferase [Firmicutes bacterium]|nr:sulfurtransferase [Bacillota bacterium]